MVTRTEPLSIIRQCELLDLPRSTFYHVPEPVSEADLALMKLIDRCHMELPFYGSRRIVDLAGRRRIPGQPQTSAALDAHHGNRGRLPEEKSEPG